MLRPIYGYELCPQREMNTLEYLQEKLQQEIREELEQPRLNELVSKLMYQFRHLHGSVKSKEEWIRHAVQSKKERLRDAVQSEKKHIEKDVRG
ncbi:uncharacterized protein N0V89_004011 [Didymosphaeria variabile]|uniref:Uncharacterized protein n=1 Tax=Didymosphaeria variabile TaxID=1932322 RepID=A0A9W8XR05_9PLEO|nr:uncharacterized protein N0V89_004011 [Didymosphaeria variabile]KAJ4355986.1 hypothetical protein N0V89_004011 [Didymosphaeria variabile]